MNCSFRVVGLIALITMNLCTVIYNQDFASLCGRDQNWKQSREETVFTNKNAYK
jgi:hypothetical protein